MHLDHLIQLVAKIGASAVLYLALQVKITISTYSTLFRVKRSFVLYSKHLMVARLNYQLENSCFRGDIAVQLSILLCTLQGP